MNLKKWLGLLGLTLALASGTVFAQANNSYKPLASPQPVETGDKIEVVEFFWYGCPHCFELEPHLNKWTAKLSKDVEFRRIPAVPTERWLPTARIYYTLEALGRLDTLHEAVFDAIHVDRVNLNDEKTLGEWMVKKGVDRTKYAEAWKSFSVQSKTQRAIRQTQSYGIDGVPALVVDGKYLTSVSMTGSQEALLKTLDALIAKARVERNASNPGTQEPKNQKKQQNKTTSNKTDAKK